MKFGDFRRNFGQDELVESHRQQIDDIMELQYKHGDEPRYFIVTAQRMYEGVMWPEVRASFRRKVAAETPH